MSRTRSILAAASVATTVLFLGMPAAQAATAPTGSALTTMVAGDCGHQSDGQSNGRQSHETSRNSDSNSRDNSNRDNGGRDNGGRDNGNKRHDDCDHHGRHPHGDPHTGLGGSITGGNATETALGGGLIALAAGGFVSARRRRSTI